jgi:hypothetical protein
MEYPDCKHTYICKTGNVEVKKSGIAELRDASMAETQM